MTSRSTGVAPEVDRPRAVRKLAPALGQIVLVFQGGGALGAYQAGVYQALHEAGIEPDWIIGTSIGAINASLIAGNSLGKRVPALQAFWDRMAQKTNWVGSTAWPQLSQAVSYWNTLTRGISGFFEPNPQAFWGPHVLLGADRAGYYSTAPLEKTLLELVDFPLVHRCTPRLTIGAAHVRTSQMHYFDSCNGEIGVKHIMASGALPPAFPAVRIDGELYWDGGVFSNTPTEVIFDDHPRRSSLIFAVQLWNPIGTEPTTMCEVMTRQKDIQYSSRVATDITHQMEAHRLRHVINELLNYIPENVRNSKAVRDLAGCACPTLMHVVRLLAPRIDNEDATKDVDFSASGIRQRWEAGYDSTCRVIEQQPWQDECDQLDGVILHEPHDDTSVTVVAPAKTSVKLGPSQPVLNGGRPLRRVGDARV